jgi:hypothetical protein
VLLQQQRVLVPRDRRVRIGEHVASLTTNFTT